MGSSFERGQRPQGGGGRGSVRKTFWASRGRERVVGGWEVV